MTAELLRIMKLFEAQGIPALAFKGPVLAQRAYGDVTLRQYGDLDILVGREALAGAVELLLAEGYEADFSPKVLRDPLCLSVGSDLALYHRGRGVLVELHWKLFRERIGTSPDFGEIEGGSCRVGIDGRALPAFSPEACLVYLCLHGAKHAWERIEWIVDIDRLVRRCGELDWEAAGRIAREMGTETTLHLGLALARSLCRTPLPAQVSAPLRRERIGRLVAGTMGLLEGGLPREESYGKSRIIYRYQRELLETWWQRVRHLGATYLWISQNDCLHAPLPPLLGFLYLVLKPYRLLRKSLAR